MEKYKLSLLLLLSIMTFSYMEAQKLVINDPAFEGDSYFYEISSLKIDKNTGLKIVEFTIEESKAYINFFLGTQEWVLIDDYLELDLFQIKSVDRKTIVMPHIALRDNGIYDDYLDYYYLLKPGKYVMEIFFAPKLEVDFFINIRNDSDRLESDEELQNAIIHEIPDSDAPGNEDITSIQFAYDLSGNRISRTIPIATRTLMVYEEPEIVVTEKIAKREIKMYSAIAGQVSLEFSSLEGMKNGIMSIYSFPHGTPILTRKINNQRENLDISSQASGIYILLIDIDGEKTSYKLMK